MKRLKASTMTDAEASLCSGTFGMCLEKYGVRHSTDINQKLDKLINLADLG